VKNITLALDDATYRAARILAAEHGKSLSGLVKEMLQATAPEQNVHEENVRRLFEVLDQIKGFSAKGRLTRAEIYDR